MTQAAPQNLRLKFTFSTFFSLQKLHSQSHKHRFLFKFKLSPSFSYSHWLSFSTYTNLCCLPPHLPDRDSIPHLSSMVPDRISISRALPQPPNTIFIQCTFPTLSFSLVPDVSIYLHYPQPDHFYQIELLSYACLLS